MANPSIQNQAYQFFDLPRRLSLAGITVGALSTIGFPSSVLPRQVPTTMMVAFAQSQVTDQEIMQYAGAVLEMDGYRTEAYTAIKDMLLSAGVDISEVNVGCSDTQDISEVPRSIRRDVEEILVGYCNQARDIVEANGLTPRRFNEITDAHQQSERLSEQIQQELIRLQQPE